MLAASLTSSFEFCHAPSASNRTEPWPGHCLAAAQPPFCYSSVGAAAYATAILDYHTLIYWSQLSHCSATAKLLFRHSCRSCRHRCTPADSHLLLTTQLQFRQCYSSCHYQCTAPGSHLLVPAWPPFSHLLVTAHTQLSSATFQSQLRQCHSSCCCRCGPPGLHPAFCHRLQLRGPLLLLGRQ